VKRLLLTAAITAVAAVPSPKGLYMTLLESPVAGAKPTAVRPGANSKRHHVVGEVEIDFAGGSKRIVYVVFPTHADAVGNHADGVRALKTIHGISKIEKSVRGLPKPSVLVDARDGGLGVTQVTFVVDNVEIATQSIRRGAKTGDEKAAKNVAQLALQHLRSIQKRG
jgi:hypothetical protein